MPIGGARLCLLEVLTVFINIQYYAWLWLAKQWSLHHVTNWSQHVTCCWYIQWILSSLNVHTPVWVSLHYCILLCTLYYWSHTCERIWWYFGLCLQFSVSVALMRPNITKIIYYKWTDFKIDVGPKMTWHCHHTKLVWFGNNDIITSIVNKSCHFGVNLMAQCLNCKPKSACICYVEIPVVTRTYLWTRARTTLSVSHG